MREALPADAPRVPLVLNEGIRDGELVFTINGAVFPDLPHVKVERNGVRVLEVKNESEMDHPFHLHGFFFQVLEKNGVPQSLESMGNKDTIIVPAMSTLKLVEPLRRAGSLDVPLPHPRARRGRHDGRSPRRPVSAVLRPSRAARGGRGQRVIS